MSRQKEKIEDIIGTDFISEIELINEKLKNNQFSNLADFTIVAILHKRFENVLDKSILIPFISIFKNRFVRNVKELNCKEAEDLNKAIHITFNSIDELILSYLPHVSHKLTKQDLDEIIRPYISEVPKTKKQEKAIAMSLANQLRGHDEYLVLQPKKSKANIQAIVEGYISNVKKKPYGSIRKRTAAMIGIVLSNYFKDEPSIFLDLITQIDPEANEPSDWKSILKNG